MLQHYFKTAFRNLNRHKVYAGINIAGLAIGLTAFWLIALYVTDEFSYDRYNGNANRIYRVVHTASWDGGSFRLAPTSLKFAPAMQAAFPEIENTVRIDIEGGGMVEHGDKKIQVGDMIFTDNSLFKIFSYNFLYGDAKTALVKPQSIVITESLANKIFGSPAKAINQNIYFDNHEPNLVTAVIKDIPENSHLRFSAARYTSPTYTEGWQAFHIYTYLLLKPGVNIQSLQGKLPAFAAATVEREMQHVNEYNIQLQPLTSIHLHSDYQYEFSANGNISRVYMFTGIAALILLIAIINYVNLSTARSSSRVKEIGVRKVTGSGKWNLAGMFISESVLVTAIAAFIAIAAIGILLPYFNQLTGKHLTAWGLGIIPTGLLLVIFTGAIGIVNGIYPSIFLSRFKTILALKGQMGNVSGSVFFRKTLVVFQFVITVVMIAGSLVIYRQLQYALHKDLGFNKEQVLTFHISNRLVRNQLPAMKAQLMRNSIIQGVSAAGNPIGNNDLGGHAYFFEKSEGGFNNNPTIAQELMADADYVPSMQIKLLDGRNFSEATLADKDGSAIINETLMNQLGWDNAIGKRLQFPIDDSGHMAQRTVVGVVKDFHTYSLQHKVDPLVMIMPPTPRDKDNLYVRVAKGKEQQSLAYITSVFNQFDKTSTPEFHFLDQNFAAQYAAEEKQGQIALIFTVLAVVIASLGLFGLATFTAQQRTKEIGIRKVLGASVTSIATMLSKDFLKLVFAAACIALPLAWFAMNQWLQGFAYRIDVEWWILALAGFVAAFTALITVSYHAIKAALANPVKAIKTE